jgi:small subunit ribosomal protein S7
MIGIGGKKAANKNLSSKKEGKFYPLGFTRKLKRMESHSFSSNLLRSQRSPQAKMGASLTSKRPLVAYRGRRKVKKVKVTKGGSFLYNISLGETRKGEHNREERKSIFLEVASKQSGAKIKPVFRKDKGLRTVLRNRGNKIHASLKEDTPLLTLLQNKLMHDGRRGPAEKIFFKTLGELNRYNKKKVGYALFYKALERLKPALVTVVRRVGRNYYNVPVPIQGSRQYKIAFQWLLEVAKKNSRVPLYRGLADEIIAIISSSPSDALKKKEAMYRSVITNRAYSHYRWI